MSRLDVSNGSLFRSETMTELHERQARRIREARDLETLATVLNAASSAACRGVDEEGEDNSVLDDIDMAALPTFGGAEPADTTDVWSWDECSLLVTGDDRRPFTVVDR